MSLAVAEPSDCRLVLWEKAHSMWWQLEDVVRFVSVENRRQAYAVCSAGEILLPGMKRGIIKVCRVCVGWIRSLGGSTCWTDCLPEAAWQPAVATLLLAAATDLCTRPSQPNSHALHRLSNNLSFKFRNEEIPAYECCLSQGEIKEDLPETLLPGKTDSHCSSDPGNAVYMDGQRAKQRRCALWRRQHCAAVRAVEV